MSEGVLSDAEAKLLMKKLNRRMSALAILTRGSRSVPWLVLLVQALLWLSIGGWMFWAVESESFTIDMVGYLLFVVASALLGIVEIYNANLNKRIDALVELLHQEGMLRPELRPDSAKEP